MESRPPFFPRRASELFPDKSIGHLDARIAKLASESLKSEQPEEDPNCLRLAVITSGGDSPGMNAGVRSVVRLSLLKGMIVYRVNGGYTGLIKDDLQRCAWDDVSGIQREGGTCLGTARSAEFRTVEGRRIAAKNLLKRRISMLVVIGGDGSLTGANKLREEWPEHVAILEENGELEEKKVEFCTPPSFSSSSHSPITSPAPTSFSISVSPPSSAPISPPPPSPPPLSLFPHQNRSPHSPSSRSLLFPVPHVPPPPSPPVPPKSLILVGMVGTIDNDLPMGDLTIGSDTALHRITHAIDCLNSTAESHSRTFVVEVMGRNCGYLAVMAALITGSDYVIIPEVPLPPNWQVELNETLNQHQKGKRHYIIILAEGARDVEGNMININDVKDAIKHHEVRTTILGHVQRGGSPTAMDRMVSVFLADKAVTRAVELAEACQEDPSLQPEAEVSVWSQGNCVLFPLKDVVAGCQAVEKALKEKKFDQAFELRGKTFGKAYDLVRAFQGIGDETPVRNDRKMRIGVIHIGNVSPGMNDAFRAVVRWGISCGHQIFGIRNGFNGLVQGNVQELGWEDVKGLTGWAGSWLGTRRSYRIEDFSAAARVVEHHALDGVVMIGGWEGYLCMLEINNNRSIYKGFRNLRLVCLPCTISNNLPRTQWTVGSDTALNVVAKSLDLLRASAAASTRLFVVDVLGSCGYNCVMGGIAGGVEALHIPEEKVNLRLLEKNMNDIKKSFQRGKEKAVILQGENLGKVFTTSFIKGLFEENSDDLFDVRTAELGHLQNGGQPSPQDRMIGAMLGAACIEALEIQGPCKLHAVGWNQNEPTISTGPEMQIYMDMENRREYDPWWLQYKRLATQLTLEASNDFDFK